MLSNNLIGAGLNFANNVVSTQGNIALAKIQTGLGESFRLSNSLRDSLVQAVNSGVALGKDYKTNLEKFSLGVNIK